MAGATPLALAVLHLVLGLPIHLYWLRGEPPFAPHAADTPPKRLIEFTHHFPFWGLAAFFVLFSGITTAMGAHLVSILRERQLPEAWVIAIPASIGALQVAGRLLLYFTEKHLDVHWANRWIPVLLPTALFVLALGLQSPRVAILYALLYGMANGMITIVKATAMATYVSRQQAASLNGLLGTRPPSHARWRRPPLPPCGRSAATTSLVSPSCARWECSPPSPSGWRSFAANCVKPESETDAASPSPTRNQM